MSLYNKLVNFLTERTPLLDEEKVERSPFVYLLLNKLHEFNEHYTIRTSTLEEHRNHNEFTEISSPQDFKNHHPNTDYNYLKVFNHSLTTDIIIYDNQIIFKNYGDLIAAFENINISTMLAFIIKRQGKIEIKESDLKPPQADKVEQVEAYLTEELIERAFKTIRTTYDRNYIASKKHTIESNRNEIQRAEEEIERLEKEIKEKEQDLLFKDNGKMKKEFLNYIRKNTMLKEKTLEIEEDMDEYTISIRTKDLFAYKINETFIRKSVDSFSFPEKYRNGLKDVLKEKANIYVGSYSISITIPFSNRANIKETTNPLGKYRNPHEKMGCYGSYGETIHKAKKQRDPLKLLIILMEFLQSINFGDAGSSSAPRCTKIVYKEDVDA